MHGISDGGVCATSKALDQPAHAHSLVGGLYLSLECYVTIVGGLLPGCRLGSESGGGGGGGGGAVRARLGLRVSGCHIVGSHMPRL